MSASFEDLQADGIPLSTILKIQAGTADEAFERAYWRESREVEAWKRTAKVTAAQLTPYWDLTPARFYLAYDGADKNCFSGRTIAIFDVDADSIVQALCFQSTRNQGPWTKRYKDKSYSTAYRWLNSLGVTPALAVPVQGKIALQGLHRFHLALWCGATSIPLLVQETDEGEFLRLVPTAIPQGRFVIS